jgi:hypothetical protein
MDVTAVVLSMYFKPKLTLSAADMPKGFQTHCIVAPPPCSVCMVKQRFKSPSPPPPPPPERTSTVTTQLHAHSPKVAVFSPNGGHNQ